MDRREYIITVDVTDPTLDLAEVRADLTRHPEVENWWNHIPGVYIVQTGMSANALTEVVRAHSGNASVLVAEVNLSASNGWLPDNAWRWVRRRARERADPSQAA